MVDSLTLSLAEAIQESLWLAPLAAFLGGLLTASNPCVLVMVPLMVGFVVGQENCSVGRSFLFSLLFSAGLTLMFLLLFLATWAASSMLRAEYWTLLASLVCILMGLQLLGVLTWQLPGFSPGQPQRKGYIGALMLGLLFGLVSMPCAGPILMALLAVIPLHGPLFGGVLLASYSLGHCGLILLGGTSVGLVQKMADSKGWVEGTRLARKIAGALILLVGVYLLLAG